MAWASRMATMAALLTATSGVVLVNDWKTGGKCCISRDTVEFKIEHVSVQCSDLGSTVWQTDDPETCAAVENNKKTYVELHECVWKYSKDMNGKQETNEFAMIAVVFSGILTIEAAKKNSKGTESNELPACVKLFKRVYTAEKPTPGAAYQKLLIEAVIDATKRMPVLLKELVEIPETKGHSNDSYIIEKKVYVDKLVSNLKETMGEGDKEKPIETNPNANVTKTDDRKPKPVEKAGITEPTIETNIENNVKTGANIDDSSKVDTKTATKNVKANIDDSSKVDTKTATENVKVKTEAVEPPKSKWHACIHKINKLLGIAKKNFVRAMRHQLRAQQE